MESSLEASVSFGPFRLYPGARFIERDGARLALGSRALDILICLVDRAGEVVNHRELTQRVWRGLVVTPSSLRVHIAGLRKALGETEKESRYIANVQGQGYCFVAPVTHIDAIERVPPTVPHRLADTGAIDAEVTVPSALPRHNLPNQLTSFIGREKEIRDLKGHLASTRLLTLTGAGGCGKTRLALQMAVAVQRDYPDGCWLVELARLDDPTLVAQAVANVLAIQEQGNGSMPDAIAEYLAPRRLLLLLDNAEHLVDACAYLAESLLRRCSGLAILVTSREPLGVDGELAYRVPSLSTPEAEDVTTEDVRACEAIRLFVERARLHVPDFEVTTKNVRALVSICRRLDGIALAIELSAPRVRTMSIEELDMHLDDRFGFLTLGHRTALPRHRTLRSLIDWSYDLLSSAEKTMLRRIAVFAGGWSVDAAEFVGAGDAVISRGDVLDLLGGLTDKSILAAAPREDTMRFSVLETVRHYALDRLRESGEDEVMRQRHCEFFMALADAFAADHSEEGRLIKLRRLDQELDNFRSAFAWCDADVERAVRGLRLAGKLAWFWWARGYFNEGRGWVERFLAATPGGEDSVDRAKALATAGALALHQNDYPASEAYHGEAISIYRRLGRRDDVSSLLGNLGSAAVHRGDYQHARDLLSEALAIARETGHARNVSKLLCNLGVLESWTGNFEQARVVLEECVSVSREVGKWSVAASIQWLGWVRHAHGQHEQARSMLTEALNVHREFGHRAGVVEALYYLGMVLQDMGDMAAAKAHLREALTLQQTEGDRMLTASLLDAFAGLALEPASPADAALLWGSSQRLREEISSPQDPVLRARCERQVVAARAAWGDDAAFDAAWRNGRAMALQAALRHALNL